MQYNSINTSETFGEKNIDIIVVQAWKGYCKTSVKGCMSFIKLNLLRWKLRIYRPLAKGHPRWMVNEPHGNISDFSENNPHIYNNLTESQAEMKRLSLNWLSWL